MRPFFLSLFLTLALTIDSLSPVHTFGRVTPVDGTPCLQSCVTDPLSPSCYTCCTEVRHEIDWQCKTSSAAACCSSDLWSEECWSSNSELNRYHACNQCTAGATLILTNTSSLEATSPTGNPSVSFTATATSTTGQTLTFQNCTPSSPAALALGNNTISCLFLVNGGPANITLTGNLTVVDTTPPTLTVPPNMTVEATSPNGTNVTFTVSAVDAVDLNVNITCSPANNSLFPLGVTIVNCTATDASGNNATSSFNVSVVDTTPPTFAPYTNISEEATSNAGIVVNYTLPAATDAVTLSVNVTCVPASGTLFPVGNTTVNCSASDAAGNVANLSFTITVTAPGTPAPSTDLCESPGCLATVSGLSDGTCANPTATQRTCSCPTGDQIAGGPISAALALNKTEAFTGCEAQLTTIEMIVADILKYPQALTNKIQQQTGVTCTFSQDSNSDTINIALVFPDGADQNSLLVQISSICGTWISGSAEVENFSSQGNSGTAQIVLSENVASSTILSALSAWMLLLVVTFTL